MGFSNLAAYVIKYLCVDWYYTEPFCRMVAFISQRGRCYVTGVLLVWDYRELHHRHRRHYGGKDTIENTIYLNIDVHKLVHESCLNKINLLLEKLNLTSKQMRMINQLRYESRMPLLDY